MMDVYVSGSLAYDRIMDFPGKFSDYILPDKIHILNVCFNVNGIAEKFGGTAGNIAYTLSLLGVTPLILATIGRDYEQYFSWLRRHEIPVDTIRVIPNELTAGAYITTDMADNQITGFNPGAMRHPSGFRFDGEDPTQSIVLIAPGNLDDMADYAAQCRSRGIPYICDPGQSLTKWDGDSLKNWLGGSMVLITNDYELEIIMKLSGLGKVELLGLTGCVITTVGEKGAIVTTRSEEIRIPAVPAERVVDPTGAGDAFRAGLLKGIVSGKDIQASARIGAVAAAYAVEQYGTQEHYFLYEEFLERYRRHFGKL